MTWSSGSDAGCVSMFRRSGLIQLSQKVIRPRPVLRKLARLHALHLIDHHLHSRIAGKEIFVLIDEAPEEAIPDIAPFTALEVAHLQDVIGARNVRLGCDRSTVGV